MLQNFSILLKIHLDLVDHNANVVCSALVWAIFIFIRRADTKPLFKSIEIFSNTSYIQIHRNADIDSLFMEGEKSFQIYKNVSP